MLANNMSARDFFVCLMAFGVCILLSSPSQADTAKRLLWGDTHLHTSYSFDAFLNGNQSANPDVAYRYARGLPVIHPYNRTRVQIQTPLDFLVVFRSRRVLWRYP